MVGFFLMNSISSSLKTSGAYEVTVNGELIFSKLKTGAIPSLEFLVREIIRVTSLRPVAEVVEQLGLSTIL